MPAPGARRPRYTAQLCMRTHAHLLPFGLGLAILTACGGTFPAEARHGDDADPTPYETGDAPLTRLREDFDNRRRIESIARAELDVNRGALTLAATRFPTLDGTGEQYVSGTMQRNGLVEGDDIVLARSSAVVAPDSLELRAASTVTVSGDVRIGPGGMTIVASKRIVITETAALDSKGPVTLMIADPDGSVQIDGRLVTRSTAESTQAPNITILGRGSVIVTGELRTEADADQHGGDVRIEVYNDVRIVGPEAHVAAYAHEGGSPGVVTVRSEADVRVTEGATLGRLGDADIETVKDTDGAIDVQAASIIVDDASHIVSDTSRFGSGIELAARDLIRAGEGAQIRAGETEIGAPLRMRAATIDLGVSAVVAAGPGHSGGGNLEIRASSALTIAPNAQILAGEGRCAAGGDVLIVVSGELTASTPATIAGGDGGTASDTLECPGDFEGGGVTVIAHEASGLDEVVAPGRGQPAGSVELSMDRTVIVERVVLAVQTSGEVQSVPLRRDPLAIGRVPRLVELSAEAPTGTRIVIELAGADTHDGPFDTWFPVGSDDPEELAPLSSAAWFKYRVKLSGRAFDAPVIDFFDIDLAPAF